MPRPSRLLSGPSYSGRKRCSCSSKTGCSTCDCRKTSIRKPSPASIRKCGTGWRRSSCNSIATYARIFGIDRKSIVNDDLDALEEVPRLLGRGAALSLEEEFWTLVLANTGSFFHADNGNLISGGGSVLSSAGLSSGVQKMLEQVDQEGKPISVLPSRLVVPPALKSTADELFVARTLNVGASSTSTDDRLPGENVHFGKVEPSPTPYLGLTGGLSGGSNTHWHLFGDPADIAAFGLAFLDGNEVPTIEQEDAPFNTLGVEWRGYLDFGVCQIDHRGAVRSAGS